MDETVDAAIIGAGAAGIAAGRRLARLGRSVLLVEALDRVGGRAHTALIEGIPLDLGCGWLHSADLNPLAALADARGEPIDRSEGAWRVQLEGIGFTADEQRAAWTAYERLGHRLRIDPPESDCAGDAVPPGDRWRPYLDALSSFINGVELDRLSAKDFLAYDDAATEANWRLPQGYGAFVERLAADLPTALGTHATRISCDRCVLVETGRGTIAARSAIITISTTLLAREAIRLPASAADHLHAAARLPLGVADKLFLHLAEPELVPPESHLLGDPHRADTASYYLRPFGRPVIEVFLGGAHAVALERAGGEAAANYAIDDLRRLLGPRFARALSPLAATRWASDPVFGGSYSHALPGHAAARRVLAAPIDERLCLAGEASSATNFSTAHGAWESGIAAADFIDRGLG